VEGKPSLSYTIAMEKYKLTISYDGTPFSGWQIQPNSLSVQEIVQSILSTILQEEISLIGASRTDAGVHAKMQVAHFSAKKEFTLQRLLQSVNSLLPEEIRLLYIEKVPSDFHARYLAQKKHYVYNVCTTPVQSPFKRYYSYHYTFPLDLDKIRLALALFIGTKNFRAFANSPSDGCAGKDPIRTLSRLELIETPSGFSIHFEGNGFLYKMVRNITGTLLEIGKNKLPLEEIPQIFLNEKRPPTITTAPAHGLTLTCIEY
jgi:tRNA pseudouridine38-40 synthase